MTMALVEELLELLWIVEEDGAPAPMLSDLPAQMHCFDPQLEDGHGKLEEGAVFGIAEGYLAKDDAGRLLFGPNGRERAQQVIRRHRLAEKLLSDVLDVARDQVEAGACRFEHVLSREVTESVCSFLGHPPACPHGRPIPRGECCGVYRKEMPPLVIPLERLEPGVSARIVFISSRYPDRLKKVSDFGVHPGAEVIVRQWRPACLLRVGETDLALDEEIVREIYVRVLKGNGG